MFILAGEKLREDDAQSLVRRAWRQVLDEASCAADMPFDEAGGDSLKLLKFLFLIEEMNGSGLPMQMCHVGLTPTAFTRLVELSQATGTHVSKERPGTVFLIPGRGGETPLEGGFRAACARSLHVATADLPDWPEMIDPNYTMDSLIERIAAEIDERAAPGPIRLVGFSLGGHVAFGAARVLAANGRDISFLGILDTSAAMRPPLVVRGRAPVRVLRQLRWEIHNLMQSARRGLAAERLAQVTAEFLARRRKGQRLRLAARILRLPLPSSLRVRLNMFLREEMQAQLLRAWQTAPSRHLCQADVPVVLFRSEEHTLDEPKDLGWGVLCPNLRVVDIAGGHKSMLSPPYVDDLAAALDAELEWAAHEVTSRLPA